MASYAKMIFKLTPFGTIYRTGKQWYEHWKTKPLPPPPPPPPSEPTSPPPPPPKEEETPFQRAERFRKSSMVSPTLASAIGVMLVCLFFFTTRQTCSYAEPPLQGNSGVFYTTDNTLDELNVRVSAALQSCTWIVKRDKASIAELQAILYEERLLRKEREKTVEELKRASEVSLRREREQQEVINKLQESEKESSWLVESLRSKLVYLMQENEGISLGVISLNDFRSLQGSNEDLRKPLENQVRTIDELKNENREAVEHHQNEMEELRDSISKPYLTHLRKEEEKAAEELKRALRREREQQLAAREWTKIFDLEMETNAALEDQEGSRAKIVLSKKVYIAELKSLLDEGRHLRKEREKAAEELKRALRKEREQQLAAREEAWGKIYDLKLVINAALQDLEGSREKIMLRETHLRAFYSTTEEIQKLFSKQQEQLKAMQRTLEDEDNDENDWFSLHTVSETVGGEAPGVTEAIGYRPRLMF